MRDISLPPTLNRFFISSPFSPSGSVLGIEGELIRLSDPRFLIGNQRHWNIASFGKPAFHHSHIRQFVKGQGRPQYLESRISGSCTPILHRSHLLVLATNKLNDHGGLIHWLIYFLHFIRPNIKLFQSPVIGKDPPLKAQWASQLRLLLRRRLYMRNNHKRASLGGSQRPLFPEPGNLISSPFLIIRIVTDILWNVTHANYVHEKKNKTTILRLSRFGTISISDDHYPGPVEKSTSVHSL